MLTYTTDLKLPDNFVDALGDQFSEWALRTNRHAFIAEALFKAAKRTQAEKALSAFATISKKDLASKSSGDKNKGYIALDKVMSNN